jgi:hypothetical protein
MIHFNDNTIIESVEPETLCGLSHTFVRDKTSDEIYFKHTKSVDCDYCRDSLIKLGKIKLTRLDLIQI